MVDISKNELDVSGACFVVVNDAGDLLLMSNVERVGLYYSHIYK